jgi:hypothetical protein
MVSSRLLATNRSRTFSRFGSTVASRQLTVLTAGLSLTETRDSARRINFGYLHDLGLAGARENRLP